MDLAMMWVDDQGGVEAGEVVATGENIVTIGRITMRGQIIMQRCRSEHAAQKGPAVHATTHRGAPGNRAVGSRCHSWAGGEVLCGCFSTRWSYPFTLLPRLPWCR